MADWGLLGALGQGIQAGISGYQTQRDYMERKRQQAAEELMKKQAIEKDEAYKSLELLRKSREEGLIPQRDDYGKIVDFSRDPNAPEDPAKLLQRLSIIRTQQEIEANKAKVEKAAFEKTPKGIVQGLGANEKQRFDSITMGSQAVEDLKNAYKGRSSTVSLIGDTPYTEASRRFTEALGRLQSQGAINKDELVTFKKFVPGPTDSLEMAQKKLAHLEREMGRRLSTYGLNASQLQEMGLLNPSIQTAKKASVGLIGTAEAQASDLPKVGVVENGYKYVGGDPGQPSSWKKVK